MAVPTIDSVTATLHGDAPLAASVTATATATTGTVTIAVNWGDGTVTTDDSGVAQTHNYTVPGAWQVTITATDPDGDTATEIKYAAAELPDTSNTIADNPTGLCTDWYDPDINDEYWSCPVPPDADDSMRDSSVQAALRWFHDATCHRYPGICTATVRPDDTYNCTPTGQYSQNNDMLDLQAGIGDYPIRSITEIVVDGEVIDPAFYQLINQRWLVARKIDDVDDSPLIPWPTQWLRKAPGSIGTWYVTVTYGREAPPLLIQAAAHLGCELWKQTLQLECEIPDGATSITREGVTISFPQPDQRRWGISIVDRALDVYGCNMPGQPRFYDPAAEPTPVTRS